MKRRMGVWKRILVCVCAAALLGGAASAVEGTAAASSGVTRGAFIQALYRAHVTNGGAPVESAGNPAPFSDVGVWSQYFEALCWAKGAGIAGGYAGGTFRPEQTITREQAAVMLYRYGKAADRPLQPASSQALEGYADAATIPPWSKEAVEWAVGNGLWYSGSATLLKCSGTVTKDELTALMERLFRSGIYPAFTVVSTVPGLTMTAQESSAKGATLFLTNQTDKNAFYGEDYSLQNPPPYPPVQRRCAIGPPWGPHRCGAYRRRPDAGPAPSWDPSRSSTHPGRRHEPCRSSKRPAGLPHPRWLPGRR